MSNRKLIILGLAALLMVSLAVIQSRITDRPAKSAKEIYTDLIQGLNPANIASIVVGSGEDAAILNRRGSHFVVANKDEYPAQTDKINDLITQLLDIKTRELVTSNPENHADLEVSEDKARSIAKFFDKDGRLITGVLIGKRAESGDSYVRLVSSDEVYLTGDTPWIRNLPMDYIDQQLLKISDDEVLSVTVTDPNESYTLRSEPNTSEIILENIPQGKKLKDVHKQVFSALTNLQFSDVMKTSSAPKDLTFDHSYVCRLKNSTVYTLAIAKSGDKTFAKCQAEFTDTEEIVKEINKVESEEQLKEKEAKLLARDATEEFNLDHHDWVYEIADWKAENLTKPLNSLLEDKNKQQEEQQEQESEQAESG